MIKIKTPFIFYFFCYDAFIIFMIMNCKRFFCGKENFDNGVGDSWSRSECRQVFGGAQGGTDDYRFEDGRAISLIAQETQKIPNIKYVLGRHDLADFSDKDMVIKAAGVPLNSPYIAEAIKNKIPVEMDASLFVKLTTTWTLNVQVVDNWRERKSTVTHLIYAILEEAFKRQNKKFISEAMSEAWLRCLC